MLLEQMLEHAKRIARRMSRDPEVESLAGLAAWHAYKTYDETKSHWRTWTGRLVKQEVIMYWRELKRRRETQMSQLMNRQEFDGRPTAFEATVVYIDPGDTHEKLRDGDWQLLCEYYIDGWPLDVVARENNMSINTARQTIKAAIARLQTSLDGREFA